MAMREERQPPRWDRWLTLNVAQPLSWAHGASRRRAVPILMYHAIADDTDDRAAPYFRTVTSAARFAEHVDFFTRNGWQALSLSAAMAVLQDPEADASKTVAVTFDDGFRDIYTTAQPLLASAGFGATVFLSTDFLDRRFVTGRECLRRSEVRTLSAQGIEFGSHSVTHRRLVTLSQAELRQELTVSKQEIEDLTGQPVTLFSYPYRFPSEDTRFTRSFGALLDDSGYRRGVTTTIGRSRPHDDRFFLPRLPINDGDDRALLAAKLHGHYDWLRVVQQARKAARGLWPQRPLS